MGKRGGTNDMHRILSLPMRPKLRLDIQIAQNAHFGIELLAMNAEKAAVQLEGWEEGDGFGEAGLGAH